MTTVASPPVTFTVIAASYPKWWTLATENQWNAIAATGLASIADPYSGQSCITSTWVGAALDQSGFEYLMVANGGHSTNWQNAAYTLKLNVDVPGWQRINSSTPGAAGTPTLGTPYVFETDGDGRSHSMHTAGNQVFAHGRVYFGEQCAADLTGGGGFMTCSWDRAAYTGLTWPVAYTGDPVPNGGWRSHGCWTTSISSPEPAWNFSRGFYDQNTDRAWYFSGRTSSCSFWALDVSTSGNDTNRVVVSNVDTSPGRPDMAAWAVICPDLRIVVGGTVGTNNIRVFNLDTQTFYSGTRTLAGSYTWDPSNQWGLGYNVPNAMPKNMGAIYRARTHSIWVGDPKPMNGKMVKITIPMLAGAFDSTVMNWANVEVGTTQNLQQPIFGGQGIYNRLQCVTDMGDGRGAIIFIDGAAADYTLNVPTYVYKLPITE